MGDRISIQFKNGEKISVAFFSHWDGEELKKTVKTYFKWLKLAIGDDKVNPIGRLEPDTVMVDFIRWLTADKEIIESNYYLGIDGDDGDNSDNGNWVFDLARGEFEESEEDV